jgi:hypothetical protein
MIRPSIPGFNTRANNPRQTNPLGGALPIEQLRERNVYDRLLFLVEGHPVTNICGNSHNLPCRLVVRNATREGDDSVVEWVAVGPISACHFLIDDGDRRSCQLVAIRQIAATHDRDVEHIEVSRRHDAVAGQQRRRICRLTTGEANTRAPVGLQR